MKMKKNIFSAVLAIKLICCLGWSEESMTIQSGEAEYDGKEIRLVGQVIVQHELGQIAARKLTIIPATEQDKKKRFSFLIMKENVVIDSKEGGQLTCQEAELDYAQLKGNFLGNSLEPDVVYSNHLLSQKSKKVAPLTIKSLQMQIDLIRLLDPIQQTYKSSIQKIQANQLVRAYYNQNYLILSDQAIYQKDPTLSQGVENELLYLHADGSNGFCQITNQNGDQLRSDYIEINLSKRQMKMNNPQGCLKIKQNDHLKDLYFSANSLIWNDEKQCLFLPEGVFFKHPYLGEIKTAYEVEMYQQLINGKKEISSIVAKKETELNYVDEKNKISHRILAHGPFIVDHLNSQLVIQSPKNEQGITPLGQQVYFEDVAADIYADQVELFYRKNGQNLDPFKVVMQGHVQILSRFDGHIQESGSVLQYALADYVEYFPNKKEMTLSSQKGKRVLLFDKVNNLQMSAPSLKIRQDTQSQKATIQGIGDVRFTFIENELDQLKQHFHFEEQ